VRALREYKEGANFAAPSPAPSLSGIKQTTSAAAHSSAARNLYRAFLHLAAQNALRCGKGGK